MRGREQMRGPGSTGPGRGFTLLEVMISIALISMLVVVIAGAMRLANRSIERGERRSERLERFKVSFLVMDAQIQSAIPLVRADDEAGRLFFEGSGDSVKFASNYSLTGGYRGYVAVTYRVKPNGEGRSALYIEENTIGVENAREMRLLDGLDEIRFEYFRKEKDADDTAGEWVETWTDELLFPRRIRIHLSWAGQKVQLNVPVRARKEAS
ncbi:MAG: general secretion pathway protein J [Syntrophorhabdus sp. PtaB.Bin047]|jgi:general secretion pathway protein J|nr:MAG: general secretion pathway protein J [Syntrophorhabdus sp. PtaB.Bin047]